MSIERGLSFGISIDTPLGYSHRPFPYPAKFVRYAHPSSSSDNTNIFFRVPRNLRFRRQDFEAPWLCMGENSWDLIRLGMLSGSVLNWPEMYHNVWQWVSLDVRISAIG